MEKLDSALLAVVVFSWGLLVKHERRCAKAVMECSQLLPPLFDRGNWYFATLAIQGIGSTPRRVEPMCSYAVSVP